MIKKSIKIIIVALILISSILIVSVFKTQNRNNKFKIFNPNNTNCNISTMSARQNDSGSDIMIDYESLFIGKMSGIPLELIQLVSEEQMQEYLSDYDKNIVQMGFIPTSASESVNVASFIKYFNITKEEFTNAVKSLNEFDMLSDEYKYSNADIEILFCNDEFKINKYFASDYCIVCDGYIYSPEWLYNHTLSEVTNTGITSEMIKEKIPYYENLPLIKTERDKFQELLSNIVGENIYLDTQS